VVYVAVCLLVLFIYVLLMMVVTYLFILFGLVRVIVVRVQVSYGV